MDKNTQKTYYESPSQTKEADSMDKSSRRKVFEWLDATIGNLCYCIMRVLIVPMKLMPLPKLPADINKEEVAFTQRANKFFWKNAMDRYRWSVSFWLMWIYSSLMAILFSYYLLLFPIGVTMVITRFWFKEAVEQYWGFLRDIKNNTFESIVDNEDESTTIADDVKKWGLVTTVLSILCAKRYNTFMLKQEAEAKEEFEQVLLRAEDLKAPSEKALLVFMYDSDTEVEMLQEKRFVHNLSPKSVLIGVVLVAASLAYKSIM